jgi:hypothetical protein
MENKPRFTNLTKHPLAIYIEIERLSVSKSALYKSLCAKARIVAESFIEASNNQILLFL